MYVQLQYVTFEQEPFSNADWSEKRHADKGK